MKLLTRRRSAPAPTVHARKLERAIDDAFGFLTDEDGLQRPAAHRGEESVEVRYRRKDVGIDVFAGTNRVGVTIGRLDRAGRMRAFERDDWSHWWWVIQDLVPDRQAHERLGRKDTDVAPLLREHAAALQECGGAVLRGDFAVLENVDWWQFGNG
jgi:hypothetical protein